MKLYWRIKKNGKWTFVAAKVEGYQHEGYVQVKEYASKYVYTKGILK